MAAAVGTASYNEGASTTALQPFPGIRRSSPVSCPALWTGGYDSQSRAHGGLLFAELTVLARKILLRLPDRGRWNPWFRPRRP